MGKRDVIGFYSFLNENAFGVPADKIIWERQKKTVNWVVPDFGEGSGGHLNIFRVIRFLESKGYECRVTVVGPHRFKTWQEARDLIKSNYFDIKAEVGLGEESMRPAEYTFATSWVTAYTVRNFRSTKHKLYFVQDFEPSFYAAGSEYVFAERTYHFGFKYVTAGGWLLDKMKKDYGGDGVEFGFSYDHELYKPMPKQGGDHTRHIFFYARPPTQRRMFELGLIALNKIVQQVDDLSVVFAGWDLSEYRMPFRHLDAGVLSIQELPKLYNECDVAIVLSATNLSLLPLELMACGVPVISNRGPNTEWLLNDTNAVLCDPTVEDLVEKAVLLLTDCQRLNRLQSAALEFARSTSWDQELSHIDGYLKSLV